MKEKSYVLVAGAGISGRNAAKLLLRQGEHVLVYDGNKNLDAAALTKELGDSERLSIHLGELTEEIVQKARRCIISPGIPLDGPIGTVLVQAKIPIWSEIELAYHVAKGKLIAITGTNGKTTTTALLGKILSDYYSSVFVVGNIGNAYTGDADKTREDSITVAEVSSFQLETIVNFQPQACAILNIMPEHLDRHKTMENYAGIKASVTKNQTNEDVCILNYNDEYLRGLAKEQKGRILFFSGDTPLEEGAWLENQEILLKEGEEVFRVCSIHDLKILGRHNYENAMAAILMARCLQVPLDSLRQSLREFCAVEHRIEYVTEKNGVVYYNDSKGTNPDAAIQAICAMVRPTILLAGGYDKGSDFSSWLRICRGKVKSLILMGDTAERIGKMAKEEGINPIFYVKSMKEAVELSAKQAESGDAVLLSPACASWGMFSNYEERGRIFKEEVYRI